MQQRRLCLQGDEVGWDLTLTAGSALRLKRDCGVDVTKILGDKLQSLVDLCEDFESLLDCLWSVVEPQAEKRNSPITREAFFDSLAGDTLAEAGRQFAFAVVDFHPNKAIREHAHRVLVKNFEIHRIQAEKTVATMARFEEFADEKAKEAMDRMDKLDLDKLFNEDRDARS